jgi:hypothetical protein
MTNVKQFTTKCLKESFNKTTSLERHLSGKNSTVASGQSPDKSSTLPGKMMMLHRPEEATVQTSADTLDTETQSPEEMCLDRDEKISEVERASVPDVPEETPPIHSETHEDELINATKNQSYDRDISKTQDECFQCTLQLVSEGRVFVRLSCFSRVFMQAAAPKMRASNSSGVSTLLL